MQTRSQMAVAVLMAAVGLGITSVESTPKTSRGALRHNLTYPTGDRELDSLLCLPVIPERVCRGKPVLPAADEAGLLAGQQTGSYTCQQLISFVTTSQFLGIRFDSVRNVTELYAGDFPGNRVIRHDVTPNLAHTEVPLPSPWGEVWAAADLDADGNQELVLQRGDQGGGGNGYLDILSAPDWAPRAHLIFPGMNVVMYATPVNVDADPYIELFSTPNTLGDFGYAMIIDYEPAGDSFYVRSQVANNAELGGRPAIADFDSDGRMEFFKGTQTGYRLFEWQDSALAYIGKVGDTSFGNHLGAMACRPRLGLLPHALLGHNVGNGDYRYELILASNNNLFEMVHTFVKVQAAYGYTICGASDIDCDGLDDLAMLMPPGSQSWEWDEDSCGYEQRCAYSSFSGWHSPDIDRNVVLELGAVTDNSFRSFVAQGLITCDTLQACTPAPPCSCPCSADPACDSVLSDVVDVVVTINVAFRGVSPLTDPACPIERSDTDSNGATDVVDVVKVIDVAFRGFDASTVYCDPCANVTALG